MATQVRQECVFDIECYRNFFLIYFQVIATGKQRYFVMRDGVELDKDRIRKIISNYTLVSFNGNGYDIPILSLALSGATNSELKDASDNIIMNNLPYWKFYDEYSVFKPRGLDHIDLMEVAPGQAGLKLYGGRLHSKRLQDLPFEHNSILTLSEMDEVTSYCGNDLQLTIDLRNTLSDQLQLRIKMSAEYGIDLRSKSDAQIAEAVIKSEVEKLKGGEKVFKRKGGFASEFKYDPPSFIGFKTEPMKELLRTIRATTFHMLKGKVTLPPELADRQIRIGAGVYAMGIGGLHSTEHCTSHLADDDYELVDTDADSFYPKIIIAQGLYPDALGEEFKPVYRSLVERRLDQKASASKLQVKLDDLKLKVIPKAIGECLEPISRGILTELIAANTAADTLKITINGSFGKFGSEYSILFGPKLMIQTTITGQLELLMMIEAFEHSGIQVISANTDGVVCRLHKSQRPRFNEIVSNWCKACSHSTSETRYSGLYSRDVNNYIAVTTSGKVKGKGIFAKPGLMKNPTNAICVDAVIEFLTKGVPIARTVLSCRDITKFITVRSVQGGAIIYNGPNQRPERATTQRAMREELLANGYMHMEDSPKRGGGLWYISENIVVDMSDAYDNLIDKLTLRAGDGEYLGKNIRWVYGKDVAGSIHYKKNGNRVPRSQGALPMMELPDVFPLKKIDFDWYISEAFDLLTEIGYHKLQKDDEL
jgi:DNA polymerase elongation subunit (family B)